MANKKLVLPTTGFNGPKSASARGAGRVAAQNNTKGKLVLPATNPGARANRVKMPEDMTSPAGSGPGNAP